MLVGKTVDSVVSSSPTWRLHREAIVNKLIEALETSVTWVDLFGVTGELVVPGQAEDELKEPFELVKEVHAFPSHCAIGILICNLTRLCALKVTAIRQTPHGERSKYQSMYRT